MDDMLEQETGPVKWFNINKGYGFITRDNDVDIFVHYSSVLCEDSECHLDEGNRVTFTVIEGPKGLQAQEVVVEELAP